MRLTENVKYIISTLEAAGHEAYVVGGSVRDFLLDRPIGDFDITTDARPERVKEIFLGHKTVDTGIKHGTVTLVLSGEPYEITTYRIDVGYLDNRHPDAVIFTDKLRDDLLRRDFTVNAMCYSERTGLVDPLGGAEDLSKKMIKAVGDPRLRFDEDALRILRALRFASVLDFEIEEGTSRAIREKCELLKNVSAERIYSEFKKLIMGEAAARILASYPEVLAVALFGLTIAKLPLRSKLDRAGFIPRLASLFYLNSSEPAAEAERVLKALKTDRATRERVVTSLSVRLSAFTEGEYLYTLRRHGKGAVSDTVELMSLLGLIPEKEEMAFYALLSNDPVYELCRLDISGEDISALGIRGEAVGKALSYLLDLVMDGKCENKKEALILAIKAKM